jgi:hypothetical protein
MERKGIERGRMRRDRETEMETEERSRGVKT